VNVAIAKANLKLSETYNRNDANQLHAALVDVQTAYTRYRLDSTNLVRYQNLWDQEITSRSNLDAAKTQADISLQVYRKSQDNYRNLQARTGTELSVARRQLQLQQNNKGDFVMVAPAKGKVYHVAVKEGQLLTTGMLAVDFGDSESFEAEMDVDESDIGLVSLGQQVVLNAEAYENRPLYTTVREIEPSVVAGNKTVKIKASIGAGSPTLFSGMSVEANIIIATRKNALVIPAEYLGAGNIVYLKKGKQKAKVLTGIRDVQYVEIISGINDNTEIIKP
jgi:HlyD family secretion protein